MPSVSKRQQRLMGTALAMKRHKMPMKGGAAKMAKHMTEKQLKEFASTKTKKLPLKKKAAKKKKGPIKIK